MGKKVILLGKDSAALCVDGIIEIFKLPHSEREQLREFLRASTPEKYVGEYKDNNKHGQGTYTYANGDKYVGEYKDGKKHGQGTYTFANGSKDVGTFENDKLNGYAITYYADGSINQEGIFKDDVFIKKSKLMKKD